MVILGLCGHHCSRQVTGTAPQATSQVIGGPKFGRYRRLLVNCSIKTGTAEKEWAFRLGEMVVCVKNLSKQGTPINRTSTSSDKVKLIIKEDVEGN